MNLEPCRRRYPEADRSNAASLPCSRSIISLVSLHILTEVLSGTTVHGAM